MKSAMPPLSLPSSLTVHRTPPPTLLLPGTEVAEQFNSISLNPASSLAARLAAGSLTRMCERVMASGDVLDDEALQSMTLLERERAIQEKEDSLTNGFAIIRPPGYGSEREGERGREREREMRDMQDMGEPENI